MSAATRNLARAQNPFIAHPWHGLSAGGKAPSLINVFIEIVPADEMKYEVDKVSGHIMIDRPQKYSSQLPAAYGFMPRSFCGDRVGALAAAACGRSSILGDSDPIDVCVLSERSIGHHGVVVRAIPIGGLRMLDSEEADDKIIAVLDGDAVYGDLTDLHQCPKRLIERLEHYFLSYKEIPGRGVRKIEIAESYSAEEARRVLRASMDDYSAKFSE